MGNEDPLELLKFCQFLRGNISTLIISKGKMTTWEPIKPGWGKGLWESFGSFEDYSIEVNSIVLFFILFIFIFFGDCGRGMTGLGLPIKMRG